MSDRRNGLDVVLLGTGSPRPDPNHAGNSVLIRADDDVLMFDCGPGATVRAVEFGFSPTDVDYLLFTHHHFDHNLDYGHLVLTRWDQGAGRIPDLRVYGPPPTERVTRLLFGRDGVFAADLVARTRSFSSRHKHVSRGGTLPREGLRVAARDVGSGVVCSGKNWTVSCTPTAHVEHLTNLSYRFDSDWGSVVITGDTEYCRSIVDLSRGADVLIYCCDLDTAWESVGGFASFRDAGRAAAAAAVERLVLTHLNLSLGADDPENAECMRKELSEIYDGEVLFGFDGLRLGGAELADAGEK
ncbi:MAG: MBL fold metallo-hydrolase [Bacillota bacterium]